MVLLVDHMRGLGDKLESNLYKASIAALLYFSGPIKFSYLLQGLSDLPSFPPIVLLD